eukprot:5912849-Prymnesium_polylepis.1
MRAPRACRRRWAQFLPRRRVCQPRVPAQGPRRLRVLRLLHLARRRHPLPHVWRAVRAVAPPPVAPLPEQAAAVGALLGPRGRRPADGGHRRPQRRRALLVRLLRRRGPLLRRRQLVAVFLRGGGPRRRRARAAAARWQAADVQRLRLGLEHGGPALVR